jgi:hypothetical protein
MSIIIITITTTTTTIIVVGVATTPICISYQHSIYNS